MKKGWTLHEMLISLVVMSGVMVLAARLATGQLRFFRASAELATLRGDASQATGIVVSVVQGVSPQGGDIRVALDSAIEVDMPTGSALTCSASSGVLRVPAVTLATGQTFGSFSELPAAGDRVFILREDSAGATWSARAPPTRISGRG